MRDPPRPIAGERASLEGVGPVKRFGARVVYDAVLARDGKVSVSFVSRNSSGLFLVEGLG